MPPIGALTRRVLKIQLRLLRAAARCCRTCASADAARARCAVDLLRRRSAPSAAARVACVAPARACISWLCATRDAGLRFLHLRRAESSGRTGGIGRGDRGVVLLLRDFVLREQRLEAVRRPSRSSSRSLRPRAGAPAQSPGAPWLRRSPRCRALRSPPAPVPHRRARLTRCSSQWSM